MSYINISKKLLDEIDKHTDDKILKELARDLLQFEIENWQLASPHYKKKFNQLISQYSKRRK